MLLSKPTFLVESHQQLKNCRKKRIIPSPEDRKDAEMDAAVVQDVKTILSKDKFKRNDKSREVVSILTASMSGPTVEKCKAKVDLAKKLGVSVRRISKGQKIRSKIFHSEQSSFRYTTRKTRSDKLSDDARKTIYDFWCSLEISRHTGNKKDVKRIRVGPKMYYSHAI